jgi:hypothetical protein
MNGPDHYREAGLILTSDPCSYGCPHSGCEHEMAMLARAQVHAALATAALAATTELVRLGTQPPTALDAWRVELEAEADAPSTGTDPESRP